MKFNCQVLPHTENAADGEKQKLQAKKRKQFIYLFLFLYSET